MLRHLFVFPILCLASAAAQDGEQLYTTYCSACHAPDGKGATGGQFPPLAGSAWADGDPARAIQVVLHGMDGPVDVAGKTYNLVMPPQGAVLLDDQIAAILTHVRSSWGNTGGKVSTGMVKKARAETADRTKPWTAPELLKLHPFPKQPSPLKNLVSRVYHGDWKKLPNFDELTPKNVEEEHDGILSLKNAGLKDGFGMVWEGDFVAPKDGEYYFRFACDDGGRVVLDGEVVLEVHGIGPISGDRTVACKLDLKTGPHRIRIEYYELSGLEGIAFAWQGPGDKSLKQLSDTSIQPASGGAASIPIEPSADRAAIYRNFIRGTSHRAIGIGFPSGVNLAYSADHMAPELVWTGAFMDGGLHWTNRGQGAQPPAGENVVNLTARPALPDGTRFKGYQLDAAGNPSFVSILGRTRIMDSFKVSGHSLVRTLTTTGSGQPIELLISEDPSLHDSTSQKEPVTWVPEKNQPVFLTSGMSLRINGGKIRSHNGLHHLVLVPGEWATITYSWK